MAELNMLLEDANHQHALNQEGTPQGWKESGNRHAPQIPLPNVVNPSTSQVHINPDNKWFNTPISCRLFIGRRLLNNVLRSLCSEAHVPSHSIQEQPDLWENPLVIGYLNVGFRRMSNSMQGVVAVLQ